jgi:5-bromo-4-chloroindolyl phosphate hydrolysis protein
MNESWGLLGIAVAALGGVLAWMAVAVAVAIGLVP